MPPRVLGWSVAAVVAAIAAGGAAVPIPVPSPGETIEVLGNLYGVGADYFDQDMHQFRCHVTPTNTSLEPFFTACTRQQARDFSGDTPVTLTMRVNPASEAANIDIQLAAAQAELHIVVPPTMITKAVGGGDRRQRRTVPDGDRTQLVVRIECKRPPPSPRKPLMPLTCRTKVPRLCPSAMTLPLGHDADPIGISCPVPSKCPPRPNRQRRLAVVLQRGLCPRDDQQPHGRS